MPLISLNNYILENINNKCSGNNKNHKKIAMHNRDNIFNLETQGRKVLKKKFVAAS